MSVASKKNKAQLEDSSSMLAKIKNRLKQEFNQEDNNGVQNNQSTLYLKEDQVENQKYDLSSEIKFTDFRDDKNNQNPNTTNQNPQLDSKTEEQEQNNILYYNSYKNAIPLNSSWSESSPSVISEENSKRAAIHLQKLEEAVQTANQTDTYSHTDSERDISEYIGSKEFRNGTTIEDLFCEMMAPAVEKWVNENAEEIFREMCQAAISEVLKNSKKS